MEQAYLTTKLGLARANEIFDPEKEIARGDARGKSYIELLKQIGRLGELITTSRPDTRALLLLELETITEACRNVVDGELNSVSAKLIFDGLNAKIISLLLAHNPPPSK